MMRWCVAILLVLGGCARRIPLPKHLAVSGVDELRSRMQQARSPADRFVAEAQLHYVGTEVRLRGTATIAAQRPASLRIDLYGPHGGVLQAFACNGHELQFMDVGASRFVYGAATRANFARLMPVAPLPMDSADWTAMLFGDLDLPSESLLAYNDKTGFFEARWEKAGVQWLAYINPAAARWSELHVTVAPDLWGRIAVEARDAAGLPSKLRIRTKTADIRVQLQDMLIDGDAPTAESFHLDPPDGFVPEYLGR